MVSGREEKGNRRAVLSASDRIGFFFFKGKVADIKEPGNFKHQRKRIVNKGTEVLRKGANEL